MTLSPRAIQAIRAIRGRTPAEPVPEAELAALEAQLGVALPEPYRAFLAHVADGLDVPGYPQIFSVARLRDTVERAGMRPAEPFTYAPETIAAMLASLERHPPHQAAAALQPWLHFGTLDGCIPIADGDGDDVVLVVTGPSRGLLFRNGDIDAPEHPRLYHPETGSVTPLRFEAWLPLWLEVMVAHVDLSP